MAIEIPADAPTVEPAEPHVDPPVRTLSLAAALAVANLYYNQPVLPAIARSLHVSPDRAGLVSMATQVGYAIGIVLLVPLGDSVDRRRLMTTLLLLVALALVGAATATSLPWLVLASLVVGITTVVPQIAIPFAAGLATPATRGRVVGRMMGALLVGILGARVVAGVVGEQLGWRWMFAAAAVAMLLLAAAVHRWLPASPPVSRLPYPALVRSLVVLFREQPVVRDAAAIGALVFLAFSAFWTTLAFRLLEPPLHYGSDVAGLFGLIGIVGASVAPVVGRLGDRRAPRAMAGVGLVLAGLSYVLMLLAGHTIAGLVVGVIVLDAAQQVVQISNQVRIYALPQPLHSRLNTLYMGTYFIGGSIGAALGAWAWSAWRWPGVCAVTIGAIIAAGVVYVGNRSSFAK